MEENTNKKLFIITPQELAELGILDSLSNIKLNKTDGKSIPTTRTNKLDPIEALRSAIKKKMTPIDKLVFKKPVEPGTSKVKKVQTEKLSEELELHVVKKPTKDIKTNQKKNIVSNKKVTKVKCAIKSKTEKNKSDVNNTTKKTKGVSIISDTNVHLSKEDLYKIVGKIPNPNIRSSLDNIIQKQTVESKQDIQDTNTINNNLSKKSSRKNKHIPNFGGQKSKRSIKQPVAKATLQTCGSEMRKADEEFNFVKPKKSISKSSLTSFNNATLEIKAKNVPTLPKDNSYVNVTYRSENTGQHKNKQTISNKTIEGNISSIPCKESNSAVNYIKSISTETEASHEEVSIKLPKRWSNSKVNPKVTIDMDMKVALTEDVELGGKQEQVLIEDLTIDCIETRTSKQTIDEITGKKLLKENINIIENASPVLSVHTSYQKDTKSNRDIQRIDKNEDKTYVTKTAATDESASDKNTEESPENVDNLVQKTSGSVIKKKVGRPKRQSMNVSTEDVPKNTPVQNLLEMVENKESSIKMSKRRNKTKVNPKVTIGKDLEVAPIEDVKNRGKQEKVLIEDSPNDCIETSTSKQTLDESTQGKLPKENMNINKNTSPVISVETSHQKDTKNNRDVQRIDKNEDKTLDVTKMATTDESASDKNTEESPENVNNLVQKTSEPVIKKKVGRPKRQSMNVSTEEVSKNTPVQNLFEMVENEEASMKMSKRRNKTKVNPKVTIGKDLEVAPIEDVKNRGKQEKVLIEDSPNDCIETSTSKQTLDESTQGKLPKENMNINKNTSPVISVETSHQKDTKNNRDVQRIDKNEDKTLDVTKMATTDESASDKNTEESPENVNNLVQKTSEPVIKKKVGRPKRQSMNVSTEEVSKNTPVQNLFEMVENEEASMKMSKKRDKTKVNPKVTTDKEIVALNEDVKDGGKQEKVLIEDSPIDCIEKNSCSKQTLDESTQGKLPKENMNIIENASSVISVDTSHQKDTNRDVQRIDKNEDKTLDVTKMATTDESASDKNTEESPENVNNLVQKTSEPVIKKKVGRPKRQSMNVSTEEVSKNTPVQNLFEMVENEEASMKMSKRRNKTKVNPKVTIGKDLEVAPIEDVKNRGKQEKVLIEDSPNDCIETSTSKQTLDESTQGKLPKENMNINKNTSPVISVETSHQKDTKNNRDVQRIDKNEDKTLDVTKMATTDESASDKNTEESPENVNNLVQKTSEPVIKKKVGRPKRQSMNVSTEEVSKNTPVQNLFEMVENEEASMKMSKKRDKTKVNPKVTTDKEIVALNEDVKDGGKQEKVLIEDSPIDCIEKNSCSKQTLDESTQGKLPKENMNIIENASSVISVDTSHQKDTNRDVQRIDKNEDKTLDVTKMATTDESASDKNTEESPGNINDLVQKTSEPVIKKKVGRPKKQSMNVSTEEVSKNTPVQNLFEMVENEEASMKMSKKRDKTKVNPKVTTDKEIVALNEDVKDGGKQEKVLIEDSPIDCIEKNSCSKQTLDESTQGKLPKENMNIIENASSVISVDTSHQKDTNRDVQRIDKNEDKTLDVTKMATTDESASDKNTEESPGNINDLVQKTSEPVIKKKVGRPKKQSIHVSTQKVSKNTLEQENILSDCINSESIKKRKRSTSHSVSEINKSHDDIKKKLEKDGDILTNVILQTEHCTSLEESTRNNNNKEEKYSDADETSEPKTNIEIAGDDNLNDEKCSLLEFVSKNSTNNNGSENTVDNPNLEDPRATAPKKKRGRKRKSECTLSPAPEKIELPTETSRSGRKRVKINYFELEGNLTENIQINKIRKIDYPEIQDDPDNTRCSLTSKSIGDQSNIDQSLESTAPKKKRGRKPKIKCVPIPVQENIEENDRKRVKMDDSEFKNTFNSKPEDGTSTEPNNVVSNASDLVTTDLETIPINISFSKPIGRRGRPKKIPDYPQYSHRDDQNNLTCAICNTNVDFDEWKYHNETLHNNLGWRLGESEIRLDDTLLLKNILNPLLSENKQLVCFKCKSVYTKVTKFISHKEECDGISCNGKVTCAVCSESMVTKAWTKHKSKHHNLAWRIGDPPLDINNESSVIHILSKAKKPFQCEKCKVVKKSVMGFLSHRGQCGLSEDEAKISCEICGKRCLPSSMPTHMKQQHSGNKEDIDTKIENDYFHVDLDVSLKKRKAATKALSMLDQFSKGEKIEHFRFYVKQLNFDENKEFITFLNRELEENKVLVCKIAGCEFFAETGALLLEHMNECPLKPAEYYACNKCYLICRTEDTIIEHLQQVHDCKIKLDVDYEEQNKSSTDEEDVEEVDENVDVDEENFLKNQKPTRISKIKKIIVKTKKDDNGLGNPTPQFVLETSRKNWNKFSLYSHAFHFTFEFCQTHFTATNLFENLYSKNMDLVEEDIQQYLPPSDVSCDVSEKIVNGFENVYSTEYNFKKFELFEVEKGDGYLTIFCGGPIHSLAWLPTPYTSLNELQILAVAIGQDFNGIYRVDQNYTERTVIQFWNFGILKNRQDIETPTFEFGLVCDYGPIWHMEWCPTGCFNPENTDKGSRVGLLAVAGSVMAVNLYSIPLIKKEETGLFYKLKPVLKLQLVSKESELKRTIFATKISWSKISGCNSIAVGYSDGNVAIYNLNFTSNLLKFRDKNSIDVLLPHKIIKAHTHFISVLSWVPIEGDRLLMTSSYDKNAFVWDLFTEDRYMTKKKKILTDGTWLTNWLSFITANEETTLSQGCVTMTQYYHREYLNENCNVSYSTGTILTLSSNDWLNGFIQANTVGEIVASFPHQMLSCQDRLKKGSPYRCLLGYTKLIDKTKSPEERTIVEKKKHEFLKLIPRSRAPTTVKDLMRGKDHYDTYEPLDYQESIDQYGVLFCNIKPGNTHTLKLPSEQSEYSKPNLYPLQEINKISFNPNRQASLYYATGYQIGFIRLNYIKSLEKDPQINKSEIS